MISMWLSVIVMLVAFVNGARNGECRSQNQIANLNGNIRRAVQTVVITHSVSLQRVVCTNGIQGYLNKSMDVRN